MSHPRRRPVSLLGTFGLITALSLPSLLRAEETPNFSGTWTWSWKDPKGETHHHVLEIEGTGDKIAARERFDELDPVPVMTLTVEGSKIRFSVVRGKHRADYSGVLAKAGTINGTVTTTDEGDSHEWVWKARRKPTPEVEGSPK